MTPTNGNPDIATAFVEARRAATPLPDFPGAFPDTLGGAYAVQNAAIALADRPIAGWKVGKIDPPVEGINRLAGPIFRDQVIDASSGTAAIGDGPAMPVFDGGFGAAEAEFLLRIGTAPDPRKTGYTMAEAAALIDAVHVGIEIASSPFPGINDFGPAVTISDFGNNNGLVVGPALTGWREADLNRWPVTLTINGAEVGRGVAADMLDGPIGAARFLFEHMAARGIALIPGQWISSGAVTGVHPVGLGDRVKAGFDGRLTVACTIAAQGRS